MSEHQPSLVAAASKLESEVAGLELVLDQAVRALREVSERRFDELLSRFVRDAEAARNRGDIRRARMLEGLIAECERPLVRPAAPRFEESPALRRDRHIYERILDRRG